MFGRIFLCGLFLLFGSFNSAAQIDNKQWEYLVVYENGNVNFNELGQKSWELVGIVAPTISDGYSSGTGKFIFKRPFDALRSKQEAELQRKNEEQLRQQQVEFADLDAIEKQSSQKEDEEKAKIKIEQTIRGVKGLTILNIKPSAWFPSAEDRRVGAEVVIDGSKELLRDGGKYRSSEAGKFIRQAANEIYKAAQLKPRYANQEMFTTNYDSNAAGVNIKISVVINYKGTVKTLAEGMIQGDWEETRKP